MSGKADSDSGSGPPRRLTPAEFEQFVNALADAFDHFGLLRLAQFELGIDLRDVVPHGSILEEAFGLTRWANRQGRLDDLVKGAMEQNPGNALLLQFHRDVWIQPQPPLQDPRLSEPGIRIEATETELAPTAAGQADLTTKTVPGAAGGRLGAFLTSGSGILLGIAIVVGAVALLVALIKAGAIGGPSVGVLDQGCAAGSLISADPANALVSSVSAGDAAMFRVNPARTGEQPGPGPIGDPVLQRTFAVAGAISASPAIVDGVAYIGTWDGVVYAWAVTAEEESPRWVFRTQGPVYGSAAVAEGTVYVGSGDGCLYAIDAVNGSERWRFATGLPISSSPAVVDGIVYFGNGATSSPQATFYALDAASGAERWSFDVNGGIYSSPAVGGEFVYFGLWNRAATTFYALYAASGEPRWTFKTSGEIYASPAVVDDTVLIADYTGRLYARYASNGEERWTFNAFDGPVQYDYDRLIYASPTVAEGTAYVVSWSNNLYAVDMATGKERWRLDISDDPNSKPGDDNGPRSSPAFTNGLIYVGSDDGNIYAVDATTGKKLWQYPTAGPVSSSPTVWAGAVYVGVANDEGSLIALGGNATPVALGATTQTTLTLQRDSSPLFPARCIFAASKLLFREWLYLDG